MASKETILLTHRISELTEENEKLKRDIYRVFQSLEATQPVIRALLYKEDEAENNALDWLAGYEEFIEDTEV